MINVTFHLPYRTHSDEEIYLCWHTAKEEGCLPMICKSGTDLWEAEITLKESPPKLSWHYSLRHASGEKEVEDGQERFVYFNQNPSVHLNIFDFWRSPYELLSVFERAPFRDVLFARPREVSKAVNDSSGSSFIINVPAPAIKPDEGVYIVGEPEILGAWHPARALPLTPVEYPYWQIRMSIPTPTPFQYKYLIGDKQRGELKWESGNNRSFNHPLPGGLTVLNDFPLIPPEGLPKWAGVVVPVFSLRSRSSLGVGEFLDLIPFIDWIKKAGFRLIQLLPVNDTHLSGTWTDSYPYSIISTCALNPIYLKIDEILPPPSPLWREIREEKRKLNRLPQIDYPKTLRVKLRFLKQIFRSNYPSFLETSEVNKFVRENESWLKPYAAFCYLRDKLGVPFQKWGAYARGTEEIIDRLNNPEFEHFPSVSFYYFLQYHLYRQLANVSQYARFRGVVLKGDLPIGVSPFSVEMWTHPEWFDHRYQAGAPPDDFSETGQNWEFPLYNWEEMERNGYEFWRLRFTHLSRFFQAIRLDHVLGFFRIWAIPKGNPTALRGRFIPSLPYTKEELTSLGLDETETLLRPPLDHELLRSLLGRNYRPIVKRYLEEMPNGTYRLPPDIYSDAKATKNKKISNLLTKLEDEVLFLAEEKAGETFLHPRFRMEQTYHFSRLPPEKQLLLINLAREYFYTRHNHLWQETGKKRLRFLLQLTDCLLCAEDLGMVPEVVPSTLRELGILSLRIERMPTHLGEIFASLSDYPYLSVSSPGTHDMPPLRLWWQEEDRAKIQYYYEHILGENGIAPRECPDKVAEKIIFRHLSTPSMFALFLIQDLFALERDLRRADPSGERINNPAVKGYRWNYRMHVNVEDLLAHHAFTEKLRDLIASAGRLI